VLTNLEILQGNTKLFESGPVEGRELTSPDRQAMAFQMDVPLDKLAPGLYTCQVNVLDDIAGSFSFPRAVFLLKPAPAPETAAKTP
jgi:hypothetical protein